jgi:Flp pilus assembly protein TadD
MDYRRDQMKKEDLDKAIEVAEEAVAGFADDGSFEQLLAMAVLELRDRVAEAYQDGWDACRELRR